MAMSGDERIPVVILCGGLGTRLREETEYRPKPMVEIGGRPILWHIMRLYAHYGFKEFILCLGYKGMMIKEYFLNYQPLVSDFTIRLGDAPVGVVPRRPRGDRLVGDPGGHRSRDHDRGARQTRREVRRGGPLHAHLRRRPGEHRCPGAARASPAARQAGHHHRRAAAVALRRDERARRHGRASFDEKPQISEGLVNGGFFVCERGFFEYLSDDDDCVLEHEPLRRVAADGQLAAYEHDGFWQCMDTYREWQLLTKMWESGKAPWKVWA